MSLSEGTESKLPKGVITPDIHFIVLDGACKLFTDDTLDHRPLALAVQAILAPDSPITFIDQRLPILERVIVTIVVIVEFLAILLLVPNIHVIFVADVRVLHIFH
jgi:hypothetical protein